METTADSKPEEKPLPLKGINLNTSPVTKRALAWSCDAELAVAADDSIHLFVPLFPTAEAEDDDWPQAAKLEEDGDDDGHDGADGSGGFRSAQVAMEVARRSQYSSGMRHFSVSHPPLDVRVNRRLWEAQGLDFPYGDLPEDEEGGDGRGEDSANSGYKLPTGAGSGPFSSAATTLNHVVALEWSPSGVGRNRRPILAVLTSSGTLAMYGEGPATSANRRKGGGAGHDASTWEVLWAVGERFVVPPQQEYAEAIISFAWAKEVSPRGALLVYANDQGEHVFLTVRSDFEVIEGTMKEVATWTVREVARVTFKGPHPDLSIMDFDYVPFGTNFGLRWTPWLKKDGTSIAILSHMERGYVGFRKVVVKHDDSDGLIVEIAEEDADGICLYLGVDAFLEWEDTVGSLPTYDTLPPKRIQAPNKPTAQILTVDGKQICRGVIATPNQPRIFEAVLAGGGDTPDKIRPHDQHKCNTIYPSPDGMHTNPIQSIVLRPVDTTAPYPTPLYTLVRLAATATNPDWYEANAPAGDDGQPAPRPQWAVEIGDKINIALPAAFASRAGTDGLDDTDDDEEDLDTEVDDDDDEQLDAADSPDVFINRYRLWGLVASPGGGSTAAMGTVQSALKPDRGGWYHTRSRLMFGWVDNNSNKSKSTTAAVAASWRPGLSTEARMWEWMYGGGPEVQGVTATAGSGSPALPQEEAEVAEAARVKAVAHAYFAGAAAAQRCQICEGGGDVDDAPPLRAEGAQTVCDEGHVFDTCTVSGMAIQAPGISRACGVCGLRSLRMPELIKMLPEQAEDIRRDVSGETCGGCGGKFLD
ncbi:uncharacterized protein E0L32_000268 [Thyridium curvatum]|uniref:Transcription factor IIIC 90kDa subunit N-terminal domain-containing protein n=1 Tax=Thyridium curvatum TaxID=1093900 RepID=A0A507BBC7_9PEZI|nr:uncharacterized protein E0L32_000268 [Thyridium curvatum]TPX15934.1 hypothetical protein E0L32_000268 [Thyridium curvatum]